MNIFQSNTYIKGFSYFKPDNILVMIEAASIELTALYPSFCSFPSSPRTRMDGRFIETKDSLRRKELHRTNQEPVLALKTTLELKTKLNLELTDNPNIAQDDFSSKRDLSVFATRQIELSTRSNKTWVFPTSKLTVPFIPSFGFSQDTFKYKSQLTLFPQTRSSIIFRVERIMNQHR